MANSVVDLYIIYQFLKRLTTPFNEWPAFEQGIIDERGTLLKKRLQRKTQAELNAFSTFDLMILKLKRLLEKIPGGKTRVASYAAALYLIKEWRDDRTEEDILTEDLDSKFSLYMQMAEEPTNSAGGGNIAGIGVGPDGEPGFTPAMMRRYKKKNKRNAPQPLADIVKR
jgi:hypothetical protein